MGVGGRGGGGHTYGSYRSRSRGALSRRVLGDELFHHSELECVCVCVEGLYGGLSAELALLLGSHLAEHFFSLYFSFSVGLPLSLFLSFSLSHSHSHSVFLFMLALDPN